MRTTVLATDNTIPNTIAAGHDHPKALSRLIPIAVATQSGSAPRLLPSSYRH